MAVQTLPKVNVMQKAGTSSINGIYHIHYTHKRVVLDLPVVVANRFVLHPNLPQVLPYLPQSFCVCACYGAANLITLNGQNLC